MKKLVLTALIVQVLIALTMAIRHEPFNLLSYINVSFFYGGVLMFIGIMIYVVQSGFFDIFTISMRKVFTPKSTLEDESMRPPSELVSIPYVPILSVGSVTVLLMGAALFTYYL